jgi:hypothetical protein
MAPRGGVDVKDGDLARRERRAPDRHAPFVVDFHLTRRHAHI